jgi:hypothetical protein
MYSLHEVVEILQARNKSIEAERLISDAYVRLRYMIPGALETSTAPTSEEIFRTTENALKNLLERAGITDMIRYET